MDRTRLLLLVRESGCPLRRQFRLDAYSSGRRPRDRPSSGAPSTRR